MYRTALISDADYIAGFNATLISSPYFPNAVNPLKWLVHHLARSIVKSEGHREPRHRVSLDLMSPSRTETPTTEAVILMPMSYT
jgi:hypothetical protein